MLSNNKKESLQIVIVGDFNPSIIQPSWLLYHGLLNENEVETAKIDVIIPDASVFEIGGWLKIEVFRDRFVMHSYNEGYYESLRDILIGVLKLLNHTKLNALGININNIFTYQNNKDIHIISHNLINSYIYEYISKNPSLKTLTFQLNRTDNYDGYFQLTFQVNENPKEIFISVNDHYQLQNNNNKNILNTDIAIKILSSEWYNSLDECNKLTEEFFKILRYE